MNPSPRSSLCLPALLSICPDIGESLAQPPKPAAKPTDQDGEPLPTGAVAALARLGQ